MPSNIQLVLFLGIGVSLIAGSALFTEWRRFRNPAAGWWSAAFLLTVAGGVLFPFRQHAEFDFLSIGVSNALFFLSYTATFTGLVVFIGRPASVVAFLAPGAGWLLFWGLSPLAADFDTRVMVMSTSVAAISLLSAAVGFTGRGHRILRALAVVMAMRATFFALRAVWSAGIFSPMTNASRDFGFEVVVIEGVWTTVLLGYLMLAALQERRETSLLKIAETDFLTGADNRRSFQLKTTALLCRSSDRRVTTLAMLDLDNFKALNDAYGHSFGDTVLRQLAVVAKKHLGPNDYFARMGGEEFAFVLPDQDLPVAIRVAECIRLEFEISMIEWGVDSNAATVSIGLATTRQTSTVENLMDAADEALYRAKANGRNRVEYAGLQSQPSPLKRLKIPRLQLSA